MASNKSFATHWQSISAEQVEIGLVHVDISYHRDPDSDSLQLEELKDLLRDCFQTVAEHWGGKLFSWDRHGGAFMFLVEDRESFDNCCLAAIQMLEMIPSLNQDLRSSKGRVEVRIACDCGAVAYDPEPANIPADFANKLARHARDVAAENCVTITDRIYRKLTPRCRPRFQDWKYSTELETALYRAAQSHEAAGPQGPAAAAPPSRVKAQGGAADPPATKTRAAKRPAARRRRRFASIVGPWQTAAIALVVLVVIEVFVVRASLAPSSKPTNPTSADWTEQVRSPEWIAWRNGVHELLASPQLNEETLVEALRLNRPEVSTPPAAVLRHDQAIGDVLQTYPRVRALLEARLGIYGEFLGTGYSNPALSLDYEHASLHEYLIPNLPDSNRRVWM